MDIRHGFTTALAAAFMLTGTVFLASAKPAGAQELNLGGTTVSVDVGWSLLRLPEVKLGYVTALGPFNTIARMENAETFLDGYHIGVGVHTNPVSLMGVPAKLGVKAFYDDYLKDNRTIVCQGAVGVQICELVPIFDTGAGIFDVTTNFFASTVTYRTSREADNWGVALEALPQISIPGANVTPKAGIAFRRLSDDVVLNLTSVLGASITNARYAQDFETDYLGVYVGAAGSMPLPGGMTLLFDGEVGLYRASADYDGVYNSDQGQFGGPAIAQRASLSENELAFIVQGRVEVQQQVMQFLVSGFVEGTYYSYAPEIQYNGVDVSPVGNIGSSRLGTQLGDDMIYSVSAGVRATMPLN